MKSRFLVEMLWLIHHWALSSRDPATLATSPLSSHILTCLLFSSDSMVWG